MKIIFSTFSIILSITHTTFATDESGSVLRNGNILVGGGISPEALEQKNNDNYHSLNLNISSQTTLTTSRENAKCREITFGPDSSLVLCIRPNGSSSYLNVKKKVTGLDQAHLKINAELGTYISGTRFTLLETRELCGEFASHNLIGAQFPYSITYENNEVILTVN